MEISMGRTKRFLILIGLVFLNFAISIVMPMPKQPEASEEPFNHNLCQYPYRTTNPPNGCDNSDPCDPENVKTGSGYCENNNENHPLIINEPTSPEQWGGK
jgi:hypothetical protein